MKKFLTLLSILISVQVAFAEDNDDSKEQSVKEESSFERKMIQGNIDIANWFDGVAEGIDLFLAGERLTTKKNETNVKIENSTFVKERESINNTTSLNVNLRLPNVEEYWQLKFTTYDETKEKRNLDRGNLKKSPRERNYGATVGVFRKLGNVRASFQPRIELQDPLNVSHTLTFESVAEMKGYDINPKLELFANPSQGTGIFTALNFNFVLSKDYAITQINDGEYEEKSHKFSVTNGISLGQVVSKSSSLSYNLYFESNNVTEYHLETYTVSLGWNQLLYRNILSYQISPYLEFQKAKAFAGVPGITFTVIVNF